MTAIFLPPFYPQPPAPKLAQFKTFCQTSRAAEEKIHFFIVAIFLGCYDKLCSALSFLFFLADIHF